MTNEKTLILIFFLQIHVSFSQLGGDAEAKKAQSAIGGGFVSLLLKSVGVAVTEVQDVEFKWVTFSSAIHLCDNFVIMPLHTCGFLS